MRHPLSNAMRFATIAVLAAFAPATGLAQEDASEAPPAVSDQTVQELTELIKRAVEEAVTQKDAEAPDNTRGDLVQLGGDVEIEAGRVVDGDVVATGGSVLVRGTVKGNVIALDGSVKLASSAVVAGDVVAFGGDVERESGAKVGGSTIKMSAPWATALVKSVIDEVNAELQPDRATDDEAPSEESTQKRRGSSSTFGQPIRVEADEVVEGDIASFGGPVDILGRVTGNVGSLGAPVSISGTVDGNVASAGGPITIEGTVEGNVASAGGPVTLGDAARVEGSISTMGGAIKKAPGAYVGGGEERLGPSKGPTAKSTDGEKGDAGWFMAWLTTTTIGLVILLILVLALPEQMDAIAVRIAKEPGRALAYGSVGLLSVTPVVIVMIVLAITILLLPIYGALLAALGLVGMAAMDIVIGRYLCRHFGRSGGSLLGVALIGFAACAVLNLLLRVPIANVAVVLFQIAVFVFGFGGALMTGFGVDPEGQWMFGRRRTNAPMPPQTSPEYPPVEALPGPVTAAKEDVKEWSDEVYAKSSTAADDVAVAPSSPRPDDLDAPPPADGDADDDEHTSDVDRPRDLDT